jgi:putative ABC transport system ATP-binding protein
LRFEDHALRLSPANQAFCKARAMIEFENVSKDYAGAARAKGPGHAGPVRALDHVSLSIGAGEFVAVRGPSGCGKSTLLMIAGGLLRASAGVVTVAGARLGELSAAALNRFRGEKIGFVFQTFHLLPYVSVLDNILSGATSNGGQASARASQLLEQFHLADRRDHRPGQLSAGERQRVAMARALINNPPIVLADEPTGNLDQENGRTVLGLLTEYHQQGGTVVLVTHEAEAAAAAGRTILLDGGRIGAPGQAVA